MNPRHLDAARSELAVATSAALPSQTTASSAPRDAARSTGAAVDDALGALACGLFALQRPGALADLRPLGNVSTAPGTRTERTHPAGPRVDAFAMLGEIGFLDF